MTEIWCAQKVSNLEGSRQVALAEDFADMTLEKLDARVHHLEQLWYINSSAPLSKVPCESLVYRIRRLDRRWLPPKELQIPSYDCIDPSALKAILGRVISNALDYSVEGETAWLGKVSQQLCHAAGRHNLRAPDVLETPEQLYAFAVELSLETDVRQFNVRPPGLVLSTRKPHHKRKTCCGCCSCFCHKEVVKRSHSGRTLRFEWLKKLWCFKKKDDDDSSVSTLADGDD